MIVISGHNQIIIDVSGINYLLMNYGWHLILNEMLEIDILEIRVNSFS